MEIDIHHMALELLNLLANSIHDRSTTSSTPFFFSIAEIEQTEYWLRQFVKEIENNNK